MTRNKALLIIGLVLINGTQLKSIAQEDEPKMKWSFLELNSIILSEFPEAYEDFLGISFERLNENIIPVEATFLIPSSYFESDLTDSNLKKRAENILQKMGDPTSCWEISVGEEERYTWTKWFEKIVKKVTLKFYIYC